MEKWNEISYNLSEKLNLSEDKFELIVIQVLGILGWKKYTGDLEIQPIFKTYARKSKRMDILVKSKNRNLFIIEVKKPSLPINEDHIYQLKEYMRFLKLDFGLLFGEKIQFYYDGNKFGNKDFILLEEIEYESNNPKGLKFVELFRKATFSEDKLLTYTEEKIKEFENSRLEKELQNELISGNLNLLIKEFLKSELFPTYNVKVINKVLETIKVNICLKENLDENNFSKSEYTIEPKEQISTIKKTSSEKIIKKKEAIAIINKYLNKNNKGKINSKKVVFSNKNKSNDSWWFERKPSFFKEMFYIVLNDNNENKLYLFLIPKETFYPPNKYFYYRDDKDRYSIGINGNDIKNFRDTKKSTKIEFRKFLKYEVKY